MTPGFSYRPGREIARGGMGAVLSAQDQKFGRSVAMKVMLRHNAGEVEQQRFLQEARVLGRLAHPNIVPVHDLGTDAQGRLFYTMKLVQGVTLHEVIGRLKAGDQATVARYPLAALLTIFQKICDAIAFAHSQGIIHRDLKPQNIMVGEFGEVLVMDWGIAKILPGSAAQVAVNPPPGTGPTGTLIVPPSASSRPVVDTDAATLATDPDQGSVINPGRSEVVPLAYSAPSDTSVTPVSGTQLTLDGVVIGSPHYMSPEQADGRIGDLDERSDVYSLGGLLYALLALRPPVEGRDVSELLNKVLQGDLTPPALATRGQKLPHLPDGAVPEALSAVCMKALRVARRERYQTVAELARDIAAYQGGFATAAERAGPLVLLWLFLRRHKALTAAAVFMLLLTAGFIARLARERDVAESNATAARQNAATAAANAELAETNERQARHNAEQQRREAARARLLLADAAAAASDLPTLTQALDQCPPDLRDQTWEYLAAKRDASAGELRFAGFERPVALAAVPGQPGRFALANGAGDIAFVSVTDGVVERVVKTGRNGLALVAFALSGKTFAVARRGSAEVDLFDTASGQRRRTVAAAYPNVPWLAVLENDRQSLVAAYSLAPNQVPRLQLLDMRTGTTRWHTDGNFTGVVIHPDGDRVLVGSLARRLLILDAADGTERARLEAFVNVQALSPDGRLLAVGTAAGEILLVNPATGELVQRGKPFSGTLKSLAWLGPGHLVTLGTEGKFAESRWVFRLVDAQLLMPRTTFFGLRQGALDTVWSLHPQSGDLVTLDQPPRKWLFPVDREFARKRQESEQAWGGVFTADNALIARKGFRLAPYNDQLGELSGATWDYSLAAAHWASKQLALARHVRGAQPGLTLLNIAGENPAEKLSLPVRGLVNQMAFDREGRRLGVVTRDGELEVFSLPDGRSLRHRAGKFERLVFAGTNLFAIAVHTGSGTKHDYRLERLDPETLQSSGTMPMDFQINSLAVSPDERWLAIAGADRCVYLVPTEPSPDGGIRPHNFFRAHDGAVGVLTFHPTQSIIATASADGTVKLWNYREARQPLAYFLGLEGMPVTLSFNPVGTRLLVDGQERTTRVYDVSGVMVK